MYTSGVRAPLLRVVIIVATGGVSACSGTGTAPPLVDAAPILTGDIRAASSVGLQLPFQEVGARFGDSGCTVVTINECTVTRCNTPQTPQPARAPQVLDGGPDVDATPPPFDAAPLPGDGGLAIPDAGIAGDGGAPLSDAGPDAGAEPAASAGTITVTGGQRVVVLEPASDGRYSSFSMVGTPLWLGGETVRVSAEGAEVPAFTTTLTAPSGVIVFQPAISGAEILLPRDADFGLVWGGGLAGFNVTLRILTPRVALTCSYPADSGQALVPILALRNLPLVGRGELSVIVEDRQRIDLPGWRIDVSAASFASLGDGTAAVVLVRFDN